MTLRVNVTDVETGDSDSATVVDGDYLLLCHDPCRLDHIQRFGNGTVVLTIKGHSPRRAPSPDPNGGEQ